MANNKTDVSQAINGMQTDLHPIRFEDGMYVYALNADDESTDGTGMPMVSNMGSNLLCTGFPEGYYVTGFANIIEQDRILWLLTNPSTGASEIGETRNSQKCRDYAKDGVMNGRCDDCGSVNLFEEIPLEKRIQKACCTYHTIKNQDCFNFTRPFPVDSIQYRIVDCGIQIFFTDANNGRRWLEFEYENDDVSNPLKIKKEFFEITGFENPPCDEPIYGDDLDCNKLNIHPSLTMPCIEFIELVSGGSNKAGVYQFFIAFGDVSGNKLSSYMSATNPIPISTRGLTVETDYVTDKAIKLEIKNLDSLGAYQYYQLAVAKTIDNVTSFFKIGTFPATQKNYIYTGNNEGEIKLTTEDVFQRTPYYKTAGHVTASNDILYWSKVAEYPKLNLQRVANKVKLMWQTIAIPEAVYRNPRNVNKFRSLMRDEVYPFGLEFLFKWGEVSQGTHVPGREATETDLEIVNNNDVFTETSCDPPEAMCCDEEEMVETIPGTVQVICADQGCTEEGPVRLHFTFPTATIAPLTLQIGQIEFYSLINQTRATGFDIFTLPPGVIPNVYYQNPNYVFEVTIPQGVTDYTVNDPILITGPQNPAANIWICHSCQHPIVSLYIKPTSTNSTTFTNPDGVAIYNVEGEIGKQEGQPCAPCDQITIDEEDLNLLQCGPEEDVIETKTSGLSPNASGGGSCVLTPHSASGCTPATTTGTLPTVYAGPDQTITNLGGANLNGIVVQGTAIITSTLWTQISGPNTVTISDSSALVTFFTNYNTGTYVFQLCVTDANGNIVVDTVSYSITVPINVQPWADPGADRVTYLPTTTSFLNGGVSYDPDGDVVAYVWSQISGPNTATMVNPLGAYTEISGLVVGTYRFKLEVTDNRGCKAHGFINLQVKPDPATIVPDCVNLNFPENGKSTSVFDNVTFDWDDAPGADSYDLYLWKDGDAGASGSPSGNVSTSYAVVTNLKPNTIYHWYVRPKNTIGPAVDCDDCWKSFVTPISNTVFTNAQQRWRIYNTATIEGGDLEIYRECDETCYQYGKFGYWESIEKYPNDPVVWGDLCGKFIKHHKVPDSFITHIHDNEDGPLDYFKNNLVFPIGVKVDHQSVRDAIALAVSEGIFTQADADNIVGYRLIRGNRIHNKSVVAKGLLFDVNQYQKRRGTEVLDKKPIYFANYPYNDLRPNPFITDDFKNYDKHDAPKGPDLPFTKSKRYTFHSPDTHFNEPSVGTELKLETVEYGQAEGYFTKARKQAKQKFLSDSAYSIALTGGILAALLATEDKDEREYTVRGNVVSVLGVASGTWGPYLPHTLGPGGLAAIGETALDNISNPFKTGSIQGAADATQHVVRGRRKDYVNPVYLATPGALSPIKQVLALALLPLMLANYLADFGTKILTEANIIIDLIKSLVPFRDWSVQYNSVGKYNGFNSIANSGNKRRKITSGAYLKSENALIDEVSEVNPDAFLTIKFNNWQRESSLYLRHEGPTLNPTGGVTVVDQSRIALTDGLVNCTLDKPVYTPVKSFYASIKNYVPDQYGSIYNIDYLQTDSCWFTMTEQNNQCRGVYGGDTFINRFGFKTKVPYFLANTFGLPAGTDFDYTLYPNIGIPRHYFNSTSGVGSNIEDIGDILSVFTPTGLATFMGRPSSIRDCSTSKLFYQNGYIYNYHYGIPYFLVESDVNVDYRHAENSKEKDFYPHNGDIDNWLQEENVPIAEDNTYFYNKSYSKQNKETPVIIYGPKFDPSRDCRVSHNNRIIHSSDSTWLIYKANDFFDFPLSDGDVVAVDGIENDTVLVRTTNGTSIFKSILRIPVDGQTVQVGSGGVFSNPPQHFAKTTLGYMGTQHKAILHTEYGHVWPDTKRGEIFNMEAGAKSIDTISRYGKENWFKENLPFQIKRDFPGIADDDLDNAFMGLGIAMAYDKRFKRFFLTKRDYKLKDKDVTYNPITKKFYSGAAEVKLSNKKYFIDKSWTISYNFLKKSWRSYYSWIPNYYIESVDFFGSGVDSGFWLHGLTNASFQVFYGKLHPFIFEPVVKFSGSLKELACVEFDTEVRRYNNEFDYTIKKNIPGINKGIVYNDMYNSGLLNLVNVDKNDLHLFGDYPKRNMSSWDIEVAIDNFKWNFNQLYNLVRDNSEIPLWKYRGNNADKDLNNAAFNYRKDDFELARLKGQWFKVMMMNDKLSNYKIIHKFISANQILQ